MSRTYKDQPAWVLEKSARFRRKKDVYLSHGCNHQYWSFSMRECDAHLVQETRSKYACTIDRYCTYGYKWLCDCCSPRRDDTIAFNGKARGEKRKVNKEIMGEYNTYGTIENDHMFTPIKKRSRFGGGYI